MKFLLFAVLISSTFNRDGVKFIRLYNDQNHVVSCEIVGDYYYQDFDIMPQSFSRWYKEPSGYYEWRCL